MWCGGYDNTVYGFDNDKEKPKLIMRIVKVEKDSSYKKKQS